MTCSLARRDPYGTRHFLDVEWVKNIAHPASDFAKSIACKAMTKLTDFREVNQRGLQWVVICTSSRDRCAKYHSSAISMQNICPQSSLFVKSTQMYPRSFCTVYGVRRGFLSCLAVTTCFSKENFQWHRPRAFSATFSGHSTRLVYCWTVLLNAVLKKYFAFLGLLRTVCTLKRDACKLAITVSTDALHSNLKSRLKLCTQV